MRIAWACVLVTAIVTSSAQAADLNITITSNGSSVIQVDPGELVAFEVWGELSDIDNEGLSSFLFDLSFNGGSLTPVDVPSSPPLDQFVAPLGHNNPDGFGGTVVDEVLRQVGGSQNTLKSSMMTGTVVTGVGHTPIILASGSVTAPLVAGKYFLSASDVIGRVIQQNEDGSGLVWATEWAFAGSVRGFGIRVGVCVTHNDCDDFDGDYVRDDACSIATCLLGGQCEWEQTVFADWSDTTFGPICGEPDGLASGYDNFHTVYCFSDSFPGPPQDYHCEDNPPNALRVDAGGPHRSCDPDGVCDIHDSHHVFNEFYGESVCACPSDPPSPSPEFDRLPTGMSSGARVFMAKGGEQAGAPISGPTAIELAPGEVSRVMMWLETTGPSGALLGGYQLILPYTATQQPDALGDVTYVDGVVDTNETPHTLGIDLTRPDWPFAESGASYPGVLENEVINAIGLYTLAAPLANVDPSSGIHYLGEFELQASADAHGQFELAFLLNSAIPPRPRTVLTRPLGEDFPVDEYQPLLITISECDTHEQCADQDDSGIRDDNCLWWSCDAGLCQRTDIVFADMGGQFGDCVPDGIADSNDRFHSLNCFANQDINGIPGAYECEANPPTAFNVDAGGPFGSCLPDGVCDGNDAFHALNAFDGSTTCSCPPNPGPVPEPTIITRGMVALVPSRDELYPGELFDVDVYLETPLDGLRGYQLQLSIGVEGDFELIDIAIHERPDAVLAKQNPWRAFNLATGQMLAGLDGPGVSTRGGDYLATFTYRVKSDANGEYWMFMSRERSFLFPTTQDQQFIIGQQEWVSVDVKRRGFRPPVRLRKVQR